VKIFDGVQHFFFGNRGWNLKQGENASLSEGGMDAPDSWEWRLELIGNRKTVNKGPRP